MTVAAQLEILISPGMEPLQTADAASDPDEVFANHGLLGDRKKAFSERILNAELDEHLDVEDS
jgi:hypothetical protein